MAGLKADTEKLGKNRPQYTARYAKRWPHQPTPT